MTMGFVGLLCVWTLVVVCAAGQSHDHDPCPVNPAFSRLIRHKDRFFYAGTTCLCREGNETEERQCVELTEIKVELKVLLGVDDKIILCGSGLDGSCETRGVDNLNDKTLYPKASTATNVTSTSVVTDQSDKTTVAFDGQIGNESVLYTASHRRQDDDEFVLLSIRGLTGDKAFQLFNQNGLGSQIELTWDQKIRSKFYEKFDPVGGFIYKDYVYFFANMLTPDGEGKRARLIRLCVDDVAHDRFYTYADASISCDSETSIVDAKLVPVKDMNHDHAILTVFKGKAGNFTMCMFSFTRITNALNISRPFNVTLPTYLQRDWQKCTESHLQRAACNKDVNCRNLIAGTNYHINSPTVLHTGKGYRSMTAQLVNDGLHSVALVATENKIEKMHIVNEKVVPLPDVGLHVGPNTQVEAMLMMGYTVYTLSNDGLHKHPIYNETTVCRDYTSQLECLSQKDPFCGWCISEQRCAVKRSCSNSGTWKPIITKEIDYSVFNVSGFSPGVGPVSGGTHLTLTGVNLQTVQHGVVEIKIGQQTCMNVEIRNQTTLQCLTPRSTRQQIVNVSVVIPQSTGTIPQSLSNVTLLGAFTYMDDPTVAAIFPNRSFASGGRNLTVTGSNFDVIQNPRLQIVGENISEGCDHTSNSSVIVCRAPKATQELKEKLENQVKGEPDKTMRSVGGTTQTPATGCAGEDVLCVTVEFKMDGVDTSLLRQTLEIVRDPVFYNFTEEGMTKEYYTASREFIVIEGDRINMSASVQDLEVTVGVETCHVLTLNFSRYQFQCLPPGEEPSTYHAMSTNPEVKVRLGYINRHVGYLKYHVVADFKLYLYIAVGILLLVVLVLVVLGILFRRRNKLAVKKMRTDMDNMELRIQTEFRQAFADLQTDMTDITGELVETGLPYNKFPIYAFQILFPADDVSRMSSHKIFTPPEVKVDVTNLNSAMKELEMLFSNKFFVLSVIKTLEQQRTLPMSEKSSLAAYLAAVFLQDLNHFTQMTKQLLELFVADAVGRKRHKSLFRRCESITEKLTIVWLEIALHQHLLQHRGGSSLIMLVKALQTVIEKSPIDDVTGMARSTLCYDQLLLTNVENDTKIDVTIHINGGEVENHCTVLGCDTVSQVKAKCLGVIYKNDPASIRPKLADVDLQWQCGKQGRLVLQEVDTRPADDNSVKLMTMAHYNVTDGSILELLNRRLNPDCDDYYVNYKTMQSQRSNSDVQLIIDDEEEDHQRTIPANSQPHRYHLVAPHTDSQEKSKVLAEAHLHKLLQTKVNVKKFVDDAVDSALDKKDVPVVVKYLFSVLEELANTHGVDQDTLTSWKNHCYPIRFWGMLLSRPRVVFDIDTPEFLQPSLDIVASTFIDSFSPPHTLSKNSAPHKLLFYKDLDEYRASVKSFHRGVSNVPSVGEREICQEMTRLAYMQNFKPNKTSTFNEIFQILVKFNEEIRAGLEEDKDAGRLNLAEKFDHVVQLMKS